MVFITVEFYDFTFRFEDEYVLVFKTPIYDVVCDINHKFA